MKKERDLEIIKDRHVKSRAKIRIRTAYASMKKDGVWNMQRRAYWNGLYDIKIIWRVVFVKRGCKLRYEMELWKLTGGHFEVR